MSNVIFVTGVCYPNRERVDLRELVVRSFVGIIQGNGHRFEGYMRDRFGEHKLACIDLTDTSLKFIEERSNWGPPEYVIYTFRKKERDPIWVGTYSGKGELTGTCRCFLNQSIQDLFSPPHEF